MRERATQVLVVGAGPVGLLAAVVLAERGVAVAIVDEAWRPATHGYALALHPQSLELLDKLGLAERLVAAGQRIDTVAFYEGAQRTAEVRLSKLDSRYPFALSLAQREVESALQERLTQLGVAVEWNHRASELVDDGERVRVTVDRLDRVSGGYPVAAMREAVVASSSTSARYVIGADGHRSSARRKLGASFEPVGTRRHYAVFEMEAALAAASEMRVVLDREGEAGLWPLPEGRCRFTFELPSTGEEPPPGERRPVTVIGQEAYPQVAAEQLADLISRRAPWFEARIEAVLWAISVGFDRRVAVPLGRGRIWLAGDAAHTACPIGMHSLNMGLEEGFRLASAVADCLSGEGADELFDLYDRERGEELRFLLGVDPGPRSNGEASGWVVERGRHIVECLPAGSTELPQLLGQLGLERPA